MNWEPSLHKSDANSPVNGQENPARILLGAVSREQTLEPTEAHLATHMAIYGGTGQGKSKFIEHLLRELLRHRRGFCLIDPHGDLSEDLLAYIDRNGSRLSPHQCRRLHYLEPSNDEWTFRYDPFKYDDDGGDYLDWLDSKVQGVANALIRMQGEPDFQGMPRLERWLKNSLTAVGLRDENGQHLPLRSALALLSPHHTRFPDTFRLVEPHLPDDILDDFVHLQRDPRAREETESARNRLRAFLSRRVSRIFDPTGSSIDFAKIVRLGGILVVNLKSTKRFRKEQANAIGGMIINEIFTIAENTPRDRRQRFYLFIDEATRFVGDDLVKGFGEARKWMLSICIAVQDLSSLRGRNIDMTPRVNSQCGIKVSFQQQNPDDLELLGRMYAYKDLDFSRKIIEVDRPDGYEIITLKDVGRGTSDMESDQTTESENESRSSSGTSTKSQGSTFDSDFAPSSTREQESQAATDGAVEGSSHASAHTSARTTSESETDKQVTVPTFEVEERDEGLMYPVEEQIAEWISDLATLDVRQAMVVLGSESPCRIFTPLVRHSYENFSLTAQKRMLSQFKRSLFKNQNWALPRQAAIEDPAPMREPAKKESPELRSSPPARKAAEKELSPFTDFF